MILFDAALLAPLWLVVFLILKSVRRHSPLSISLWLAF